MEPACSIDGSLSVRSGSAHPHTTVPSSHLSRPACHSTGLHLGFLLASLIQSLPVIRSVISQLLSASGMSTTVYVVVGVLLCLALTVRSQSVLGDPQFVGLRGQSYQVHGIDGAVYNLISEQHTQVNARFAFLTDGDCPWLDGKPDTNCWSHPGSYLGEISYQAIVDGKLHAARIQAGTAQHGFATVQVDNKPLKVGGSVSFGAFSIKFASHHTVIVTTENFSFNLSNSDLFINQAIQATRSLSKLESHGLLGQTHSTKTWPTSLRYIEGDVDDYVILDGDIFGTDFVYNRFHL